MPLQSPERRTVVSMPGMFNETMDMLTDAHQYFSSFAGYDQSRMPLELRPIYASEMSRITLRLSSVMAWLMIRRAVTDEKLTLDEAMRYHSLAFQDTCQVNLGDLTHILPPHVCELMQESLELYQRALRLDGMSAAIH